MDSAERDVATLGGGCFWCVEAVFEQLQGVLDVVPGYAGGSVEDPSYEQVCRGDTGHAEVVQITFDPQQITFRQILEVFFEIHDPTTLNRQGGDVGSQYRSVIFYHDSRQREIAEGVIRELEEEGLWGRPIVTEITPMPEFYEAEPYHHEYYRKNPQQPYCRVTIAPKVAKLRKNYDSMLKT